MCQFITLCDPPADGRPSAGWQHCSAFYAPDTLGHFLCLFDNITFWGEAVDSSSELKSVPEKLDVPNETFL